MGKQDNEYFRRRADAAQAMANAAANAQVAALHRQLAELYSAKVEVPVATRREHTLV